MFVGLGSVLYVFLTAMIGVYCARKVNTIKGFAMAGRSLPLYITISTVFATWFGSESIIGNPGAYASHGLMGLISDPFGSCLCLIVIGLFLARAFYRLNVTTLVDFLRERYNPQVELLLGCAVSFSYLSWIAAQFIAFSSVLTMLFPHTLHPAQWIILGGFITLISVFNGGLTSVAINDFVQMLIILLGLLTTLALLCHGPTDLLDIIHYSIHQPNAHFHFDKEYPNVMSMLLPLGTAIMGTIPQQDTFQRVISAKDERTARLGTILGGLLYFVIAFIPLLILMAAKQQHFRLPQGLLDPHHELFIVSFLMHKLPPIIQILFFGGLLAAILSTISGTTLAAAVVFSENVFGHFFPSGKTLLGFRISVVFYLILVLLLSTHTHASIHFLEESSGQVTMVMAFFPLIFGLFWKRASTTAALTSAIVSGVIWCTLYEFNIPVTLLGTSIPADFIGGVTSGILMVLLSWLFPHRS